MQLLCIRHDVGVNVGAVIEHEGKNRDITIKIPFEDLKTETAIQIEELV